MKLCLKKKERNNRIRYDLEKLRNSQIANEYKEKLELVLSQTNKDDNNVTKIVSDIEKAIHITAETIIGKYRRKKQPWNTNDILDLCDKIRVLNALKKNNSDIKEEYREINISIRKQMKNAKENWIQEQCNAINEDMARGRSNKRAYQILKTLTNPIKRKTMIIEDENQNNKRIADNESLLKTWTEYCNNLYNYPIKPNINKLTNRNQNNTNIEETLPILKSEVENAINMLKNDKTPGNDNISAELIKHGGESIIKIYTEICQHIWKIKIWQINGQNH